MSDYSYQNAFIFEVDMKFSENNLKIVSNIPDGLFEFVHI